MFLIDSLPMPACAKPVVNVALAAAARFHFFPGLRLLDHRFGLPPFDALVHELLTTFDGFLLRSRYVCGKRGPPLARRLRFHQSRLAIGDCAGKHARPHARPSPLLHLRGRFERALECLSSGQGRLELKTTLFLFDPADTKQALKPFWHAHLITPPRSVRRGGEATR